MTKRESGKKVDSQNKGVSRLRISGSDLRQMLAVGTALLEENVDAVNALNVFPVPDGDTGTNMLLTMQSAMEEVSRVSGGDFGAVAHAAAHGSLMGARGNSGVILSQILRGVARAADSLESVDAEQLAAALKEGANTAYRGIGRPVEGTMLTVAREAADAAVVAAQSRLGVGEVLREAVQSAERSLKATPDLLPILKEAGVVDAGGQGYLLLLQGALMSLMGERTATTIAWRKSSPRSVSISPGSSDYGYCTEVLIRGRDLRVEDLRRQVEFLGTSVMVVGDQDLIHIHVHTHRPGEVLNLASGAGSMEKVKVENMQLQHTAFLSSKGAAEPVARQDGVGVAAVATGNGLLAVFRDLGAAAVIHGGQSMNPSIEELVHGVTYSGFSQVILLPNNPNVILTAQKAQALAHAELKVIPTRTVVEGIAAMVAFNPEADLETNVAAMTSAASTVQSIELTRAVRSTRVNGLEVTEGQAIGLLDGVLLQAGNSLAEVALQVLEQAKAAEHEVVTLYYGEGVSAEECQALAACISSSWPRLQVETVDGGQPHYPYIISVE